MKSRQSVRLGIKQTVNVSGIMVSPATLSLSHEFDFEGASCRVELPKRPKFHKNKTQYEGVYLFSHRVVRNRVIPVSCVVTRVSLTIDFKKTVPFRLERKKTKAGTAYFVREFTEPNKKKMESVSQKSEGIADRALNYWISIIRWRCDHPLLRIDDSPDGHAISVTPQLIDLETDETLPLGIRINIGVNKADPISRVKWRSVQNRLNLNEQIPLWILYLRDSRLRFAKSDYRSAILFLAVACESLLRNLALDIFENRGCKQQQKTLEKLSLRYLTDTWEKFEPLKRHGIVIEKGHINTLFELRNDIMHRGIYDEEKIRAKWKEMYAATAKIVETGQITLERSNR